MSRGLLFVLIVSGACASSPAAGPVASRTRHPVPRLVQNVIITDSVIHRSRQLGVMYRYGSGHMRRDVFIYPDDAPPDVARQAALFIDVLEIERKRKQMLRYEVLSTFSFTIPLGADTLAAQEVVVKMERKEGVLQSYFAVVSLPAEYVKFRMSPPVSAGDIPHRDFVIAWLQAYLNPTAH
jgi:hypothetical protein